MGLIPELVKEVDGYTFVEVDASKEWG